MTLYNGSTIYYDGRFSFRRRPVNLNGPHDRQGVEPSNRRISDGKSTVAEQLRVDAERWPELEGKRVLAGGESVEQNQVCEYCFFTADPIVDCFS